MNPIFDYLRTKDLIVNSEVNEKKISSLSLSQFVELNEELEEIIRAEHKTIKKSTYSYSSSLNLSGSSIDCRFMKCRLKRLDQLARFALLYSDQVVIPSYFTGYSSLSDNNHLESQKYNFYADLALLSWIEDPIQNDTIQIFSPETNLCFGCQASKILGKDAEQNFNKAYQEIQNAYLDNMNVECVKTKLGYDLISSGPDPFFDHKNVYMSSELHPEVLKRKTITKRINNGTKVNLSKTLIKGTEIHKEYAHKVALNSMLGLATSKYLNTNFLTENNLHVNLLNSLHSNEEIVEKNRLSLDSMTSTVPFLEDVALHELKVLREKEAESFIIYRQSLNQAINEFIQVKGEFTEKDANELYSDIIAPSIAQLDIKVKKAKNSLISKPFRSATGVVGAISFGLLTGLIPSDITAVASALGVAKFGSDLIKDTMATGDSQNAIKSEQFYFLWKAKQLKS